LHRPAQRTGPVSSILRSPTSRLAPPPAGRCPRLFTEVVMSVSSLDSSPLGKTSEYISTYTPSLLSPIPRQETRRAMGLSGEALPFQGADLWTAYEISWLNNKGKPLVAVGYFSV